MYNYCSLHHSCPVHTVLVFMQIIVQLLSAPCIDRKYTVTRKPIVLVLRFCLLSYICNIPGNIFLVSVNNIVTLKKLDGHGRARREAARRSKSEWKVNLDIRNSSRSNGSGRTTT